MTVDLLCMGEPMLEFTQLPPQPEGSRHYLEGHGGDTSNAAIAAARQGARVGYITALGRDMPGDSFMALWAREGVDASTVIRTDRWLTGVYFVTHDAQGHHFLHYRANSAAAMYSPADLPEAAIAAARMLYVSGISQGISNSAADAVFAAIDIARRNDVKVAYDTNYRPRLWSPARAAAVMHAAIAQTDYALPGIEDVRIPDRPHQARRDPGFLSAAWAWGCGAEDGRAGAWLATPVHRVHIPSHDVEAVDATGAGDAFCGSFLARILAGDASEQAARYAAVAAALKCTGYGAVAPIPHATEVFARGFDHV